MASQTVRNGLDLLEGKGREANPTKALRVFEALAAEGDAEAQYQAGLLLDEGTVVSQNRERALAYFRASGIQRNRRAAKKLTACLQRDPSQAIQEDVSAIWSAPAEKTEKAFALLAGGDLSLMEIQWLYAARPDLFSPAQRWKLSWLGTQVSLLPVWTALLVGAGAVLLTFQLSAFEGKDLGTGLLRLGSVFGSATLGYLVGKPLMAFVNKVGIKREEARWSEGKEL